MQRRSFLRRGLLGGALLLIGGGAGLALRGGSKQPAPRRPLLVVDAAAFPVLVAVAARVLDGTQADPVEIAHTVDAALLRTNLEGQRDFSKVLMLFENALPGLLLRGSVTPFSSMAPDAQDRALRAWGDSRLALLRGAYHAMRKLCLGAFFASPSSWPLMGYAGPMITKPEPPPITARGALSPPFDLEAPP